MYRRSSYSSNVPWYYYAIGAVVLFIIYGLVAASVSDSKATQAAEDLGFTDVKIESSTIWWVELRGCSKGDEKMWVVSGTNPRGEQRTFKVCAGVLKGGTVRSAN